MHEAETALIHFWVQLAASGSSGLLAAVTYVLVLDQTMDEFEARGRLEFPVSNRNYQTPNRYTPLNLVEQLGLAQAYRSLIKVAILAQYCHQI